MNIKQVVEFKKDIYALDESGNLYIHFWNYEKLNKNYEWKLISNSQTDSNQPKKMVSLFSDNRNLYSLGDNGCIFKFVEGKYNLSTYNWRLHQQNKFKNNENISIQQIVNHETILATNNQIYRRGYANHEYIWEPLNQPTSYIVSSII